MGSSGSWWGCLICYHLRRVANRQVECFATRYTQSERQVEGTKTCMVGVEL